MSKFKKEGNFSKGRSDSRQKSYGSRDSFGEKRNDNRGEFKPKSRFGDRDEKPRSYGSRDGFGEKRNDNRGEFKPKSRFGDRDEKPRSYGNREGGFRENRNDDRGEFKPKSRFGDRDEKPRSYGNREGFRENRNDDRGEFKPKGRFGDRDEKPRSYGNREGFRENRNDDRGEFKPKGRFGDRDEKPRSYGNREGFRENRNDDRGEFKPKGRFGDSEKKNEFKSRKYEDNNQENREKEEKRERNDDRQVGFKRPPRIDESRMKAKLPPKVLRKIEKEEKHKDGSIRLNRFIANAGVCSRREADELIANGEISVNGKAVSEMGLKIMPSDIVRYKGKVLKRERFIYVLLNKPKDYITTTDDPEERRTVMDLIEGAGDERIYPVGRLDRNTTGLLLLTNDGELAEKLSHPSNEVHKIYQVEIDKPFTEADFDRLKKGIELEDGFIKPDDLAIVTPDAEVVGIEIHSGKNRIVRRIFEQLGYEVLKLDRSMYAGLTKKELPRGKWRFLTEKEVIKLKYMN